MICLTGLGGSELCEKLASDIWKKEHNNELYSFMLSPACGAIVAEMLEDKYTLDDAIENSIIGAVDDMANSGLNSDNLFGWLIGSSLKVSAWALKLQQFENCRPKAKQKCQSYYNEWVYKKDIYDSKFQYIKHECNDLKQKIDFLSNEYDNYKQELTKVNNYFNIEKTNIEKIKEKQDVFYESF